MDDYDNMAFDADFGNDMALGANLYDDASPDILGVPNAQADFWEMQEFADNCEPTAEASIIRQFGFDNISTNDFAYISHANGWYQPGGGTSPEHIGDMMDLFGIGNHSVENATVEDLATELAQGHGIIVGVRSDQLWEQGPLQELWNWLADIFGFDNPIDAPADHAVCVTGIDMSDPDNPMVILNDPGHPDGQGASYPLDRFMDAWENSNFIMTATDNPLPAFTTLEIQSALADYLPDQGVASAVPGLGASSEGGGFSLQNFADSVQNYAAPIAGVLGAITAVVGATTGLIHAFDNLGDALSGDDFAYII